MYAYIPLELDHLLLEEINTNTYLLITLMQLLSLVTLHPMPLTVG